MTGDIQFLADVPSQNWVVVKKMKIDKNTTKLEIARFLSSVHLTLNNKMFQFLGEAIDIKSLNEIVEDVTGAKWDKKKGWVLKGRVSEEKIASALAKVKSPSMSKRLAKLVKTKKEMELAKVYITRNVIDALKFQIEPNPSQIDKVIDERTLAH